MTRLKGLMVVVVCISSAGSAQAAQPEIVLKNWPAPLYWQATPVESESSHVRAEIHPQSPGITLPTGPLVFIAMTPCRVVDTRASQMFPSGFGQPSLTPGPVRSFALQSSTLCSIPDTAQAYSLNITAVPPGPLGFLTVWPTGVSQPNAVTLDDLTGDIRNNAAIVPAGTPNGSVSAVVNANTDLVIDINGYYAPLYNSLNTASGLNALANNTTGTYNTADGSSALSHNTTGSSNTATGNEALSGNTTGSYNTASGAGALVQNTSGSNNTAFGSGALFSNTIGIGNSASGYGTPNSNTIGVYNTAHGLSAMYYNTTGRENTASGAFALFSNTTGNGNTANGFQALQHNTTANYNTAAGHSALSSNTTGYYNTALGYQALTANSTGYYNTASGFQALVANTTGIANTATGLNALSSNTTGNNNTAIGYLALVNNNGSRNTAVGYQALNSTGTGTDNIAVGDGAGLNITTGSYNIDIGAQGFASDDGVIRIGAGPCCLQTSFYAAGIRNVTTGNPDAIPVLIDQNGQLGTMSSSRRYKEDIQDMSDASTGLLRLRPVTFRYRKPYVDGSKPLDYGLIAEEVAEVYPDLVVRSAEGQIETVQYHKLIPLLLNELQKEHETTQSLQAQLDELRKEMRRSQRR